MTNETSYAPIKYVCNGVSVDFAFPWKIFEEKDLIVQAQGESGLLRELTLGVDYSVEFDEVGGNVKLNQTYAEGDLVVISRNVSDYQSKSYSTSSGFQSSEIEDSFDRVSCNLQEMEYNIENFKEVFSQTVNQEIDVLEGVIEENKQEVLVIQERFEDEVNTKIEAVSEAAGKINALEQAVLDAQTSAELAEQKAEVAEQKAQEATDILEDITEEGQKQITNIKRTGFYMRDDKLYFINSKGEEEEFKSGGSGFNLGDMIITDHILEGEEAIGKALQGTYVYKNAVAGERFGYPDFYNKYLEEFANTEALPLTDVTPLEISSYTASSGWSNVANVLDGSKDTYATCGTSTDYIEFSFATETALSGVVAIGQYVGSVARDSNIAVYSVDSSGNETLLGSSSDAAKTSEYTATVSLDNVKVTKVRIKLITGSSLEPSTSFKTRIKEITFVGEGVAKPVYYYKNPNGHRFYNIANKASFDEMYEQYGIADFYGIDEENERIFLPRNKYSAVKGDVLVAGNGQALGLTDGTNERYWMNFYSGTNQFSAQPAVTATGGEVGSNASISYFPNSTNNKLIGVNTNSTKSGLKGQLQPNENRYLYYCVGNTVSDTSWVDVVTQVEGGVKDLVDATNEGIERLKASSNALTTLQISNCTTEIPQRIKYTLESGTLTIKAGSVLIVPYGTEDKTQQHPIGSTFVHENFKVVDTFFGEEKFFVWAEVQNDFVVSGNASGSAISNRACFVNLTTNKLGLYMKEGSGTAASPISGQNLVYYNTDSNTVINYNLGSLTTDVCSFPILRASNNSQYLYNELTNVFNGIGYIGASVWLDKNYKALIPNGKNEDGTLKSIYCDNQKLLINNTFNTAVNNVEARLYTNDGGLNFEIGRNSYNEAYHYDAENNCYYRPDGLFKNSVLLAVMNSTTSGITSFEAKDVFRADNQSKSDKAEIVSWGIPDYSAGVSISSLPYTAPEDGLAIICGYVSNGSGSLFVNGKAVSIIDTNAAIVQMIPIKVSKNDVISTTIYSGATIPYTRNDRNAKSIFYPLKGVK